MKIRLRDSNSKELTTKKLRPLKKKFRLWRGIAVVSLLINIYLIFNN